jgi:MoxR-like ATPase
MYDQWTPRPTIIEGNKKTQAAPDVPKPKQTTTLKHCQQDTLRDVIRAGCHTLLVGQAGTGKTQAAELGLDYYPVSIGEQTTKTDLLGYCSPVTGDYVSTPVRQAFEGGGILLLDEIDAGNANTLTILNGLLANGQCSFPDGAVRKHESFYVVAAANTFCNGADRKYVGRNKLDGAFLDRFVMIDWMLDEALEEAIARSILDSPDTSAVLGYVRSVRRQVIEKRLDIIVSPRAVIAALRLMKTGMSYDEAMAIALLNKIDSRTKDILQI